MASGNKHIAIVAPPTLGHLNPLQVLGAELAKQGWRSTFVHVAGVKRFVTGPRLGFAPLPDRTESDDPLDLYLDTLARPAGLIGLTRMIRATAGMTKALLRGAPAVLEQIGIDAVIADAAEPAGPLIARRLRVPYVVSVTGLPLLSEESVPPPFVGWRYRTGAFGRHRNRAGYSVSEWLMRPISRVLETYQKTWGLGEGGGEPRVYVAQCPRGLDYPRQELPARFLYGSPWRQPGAAELTVATDSRPLVFCSLGTLQGSRRRLLATMASACDRVGARAVIGHGGGLTHDEEAGLPGNPLVRAFWPQEQVLQHCAAAVLHAGFNSTLDALAAAVLIVALPIAFEQPATAARLERIGAGKVLSPQRITSRSLAAALDQVLTKATYRSASRIMAAEIGAGGGAAAAAGAISAALR